MHSFTKELRLNKADDFSSVFILRKVRSGKWLKIHFKPSELSYSRLGVVVSKKNHKRSNKRNYMKRVIRELFRINQTKWSGYDIIVRVNKFFTHDDFNAIQEEFNNLTQRFLNNDHTKQSIISNIK